MTKSEEAAKEYVDKEYWGNPNRLRETTDTLMQKAFIACTFWLLEQAKKYGRYIDNADELAGWKSIYIHDLEELCQSKKE